ncbi:MULTISPECIES: hypothetical protein [Microbispora]|uniref:Uncharacterized protein n=1 Tax=Microbispora hainanensis TaxID=568844 RepID=A0ABZ1ST78_9ACTN|nr:MULTISPECIES: hypothetical protein [Microbispora]
MISIPEGSGETLRELARELVREDHWRGRVTLVERPPEEEALGPILDALSVLATPVTVSGLIMGVTTWLRYRTSDLDVKVTRSDRSTEVTLSAKRLRRLDAVALEREISEICRCLDGGEQPRPGDQGGDGQAHPGLENGDDQARRTAESGGQQA